MTASPETRFTDRPTRFVGVDERQGWRLKHYEITLDGAEVAREIRAAMDAVIDEHLAGTTIEPFVGFVIVHAGKDAVWLLIDLWQNELLYHAVFRAELDSPGAFAPVASGGLAGCVWEFRVIAHEREAYVGSSRAVGDLAWAETYLSDSCGAAVSGAKVNGQSGHRATIETFNTRWNAGDVNGLMDLLSEFPEYRASTGWGPGEVYRGRDEVRTAIERIMASESTHGQPPPTEQAILIEGHRGISSWAYQGRDHKGKPCVIEGVDLWTFDGDRIAIKDAYRKAFLDPCESGG